MEYEKLLKNLKNRGFDAYYCTNDEEAIQKTLDLIGNDSVGIGGSITVRDLGLYERLIERGNSVFWNWKVDDSQKDAMRREAMRAQVYLCSANALLVDGRVMNIDGTGNRVAATTFGPARVIMIIGKNKLVNSVDEGIERTRKECCPQNARRMNLKTPCAITGTCTDCTAPDRMCNIISIFERKPNGFKSFVVVFVDKELGL